MHRMQTEIKIIIGNVEMTIASNATIWSRRTHCTNKTNWFCISVSCSVPIGLLPARAIPHICENMYSQKKNRIQSSIHERAQPNNANEWEKRTDLKQYLNRQSLYLSSLKTVLEVEVNKYEYNARSIYTRRTFSQDRRRGRDRESETESEREWKGRRKK